MGDYISIKNNYQTWWDVNYSYLKVWIGSRRAARMAGATPYSHIVSGKLVPVYEPVKKLKGFAYYLVEENGQPTLVKTPTIKQSQNLSG